MVAWMTLAHLVMVAEVTNPHMLLHVRIIKVLSEPGHVAPVEVPLSIPVGLTRHSHVQKQWTVTHKAHIVSGDLHDIHKSDGNYLLLFSSFFFCFFFHTPTLTPWLQSIPAVVVGRPGSCWEGRTYNSHTAAPPCRDTARLSSQSTLGCFSFFFYCNAHRVTSALTDLCLSPPWVGNICIRMSGTNGVLLLSAPHRAMTTMNHEE